MSDALNALVAKKVMGWVAGPRQGGVHVNRSWKNYRLPNSREIVATTESFSPSTDISSAWEVWSNPIVRRHVEYIMPSIDHEDGRLMHWCCAVRFNKDRFGCVHNNPAMALCEAALRAVGVSESEIDVARNQTKGPQ